MNNSVENTGNKAVLIDRIAECKMYGFFSDCLRCGRNKLQVTYPQRFGHDRQ